MHLFQRVWKNKIKSGTIPIHVANFARAKTCVWIMTCTWEITHVKKIRCEYGVAGVVVMSLIGTPTVELWNSSHRLNRPEVVMLCSAVSSSYEWYLTKGNRAWDDYAGSWHSIVISRMHRLHVCRIWGPKLNLPMLMQGPERAHVFENLIEGIQEPWLQLVSLLIALSGYIYPQLNPK